MENLILLPERETAHVTTLVSHTADENFQEAHPSTEQVTHGPTPESHSSYQYDHGPPLVRTMSVPDIPVLKPPDAHENNIVLPNLESFSCLPPFNHIEYDEGELYLQTEIRQGALLYGYTGSRVVDTTSKKCWRLQRLFAKNVLPWIPLFDQEYCISKVTSATECGFESEDLSVALVMFIFALGAMSNDDDCTSNSTASFAGIAYFLQGCKIVDASRTNNNTITMIQCRILWAIYLLYCMRPLQAWNIINEALRESIILCHLRTRMGSDSRLNDLAKRAYWASYILDQ